MVLLPGRNCLAAADVRITGRVIDGSGMSIPTPEARETLNCRMSYHVSQFLNLLLTFPFEIIGSVAVLRFFHVTSMFCSRRQRRSGTRVSAFTCMLGLNCTLDFELIRPSF